MRNEPASIGGIPREAAPNMVIDTSSCHGIKGAGHHPQYLLLAASSVTPEKQRKPGSRWKFRCVAESAMPFIELVFKLRHGLVKNRLAHRHRGRNLDIFLEAICESTGLVPQAGRIFLP